MTLLTADDFRGFVETGLSDSSLEALLDWAEAEIDQTSGPVGQTLAFVGGGYNLLALPRPAVAVSNITETRGSTVTTLATDDYLLYPGGYVVERLSGGTNSRSRWSGRVAVTFIAADDEDIRKGVQRDLVMLALNFQPGVTEETIGDWTQRLASNSVWNNNEERLSILSRLSPDPYLAVVGG